MRDSFCFLQSAYQNQNPIASAAVPLSAMTFRSSASIGSSVVYISPGAIARPVPATAGAPNFRRSIRPRDVLIARRRHDVISIEDSERLERHRLFFVRVG